MNSRFMLVLILVTFTLLGWTFLHYQFQENRQFRLRQIPGIPVYVYMEDTVAMDSLAIDLFVRISEIDSLAKESGVSAAESLLQEYELSIEPGTLGQYSFPNVMTLIFKPRMSSLQGRTEALKILAEHDIPEADIDGQEPAWALLEGELNYLGRRWTVSTLFTAVLFFLMFLFARLWIYARMDTLAPKRGRSTLIETIRRKETTRWQNALLIILPIDANAIAYFALVGLGILEPLVDWIFFVIQFVSLLAALLISVFLENARQREASAAHSITVNVPQ